MYITNHITKSKPWKSNVYLKNCLYNRQPQINYAVTPGIQNTIDLRNIFHKNLKSPFRCAFVGFLVLTPFKMRRISLTYFPLGPVILAALFCFPMSYGLFFLKVHPVGIQNRRQEANPIDRTCGSPNLLALFRRSDLALQAAAALDGESWIVVAATILAAFRCSVLIQPFNEVLAPVRRHCWDYSDLSSSNSLRRPLHNTSCLRVQQWQVKFMIEFIFIFQCSTISFYFLNIFYWKIVSNCGFL